MRKTVSNSAMIKSLMCGGETAKCRPGYYTAGSSCLPCKIGTYQPNANQGSCIQCEYNIKTNSTASTSENDCQGMSDYYCAVGISKCVRSMLQKLQFNVRNYKQLYACLLLYEPAGTTNILKQL